MIDLFGLKSKKKIRELEARIRGFEIGESIKIEKYVCRPISVRAKQTVSGEELGRVENLDSLREVIKKSLCKQITEKLVKEGCINITESHDLVHDGFVMIAEMQVIKDYKDDWNALQ